MTTQSPNLDAKPVTGSCLCGKITVEIACFARDVVACHCQQCRKQTGTYVSAASVENTKMRVIGEQHLKWYAASSRAKRGFCIECGSLMFWKSNGSDKTSIMAGCLEAPTGLQVISHIFVADKGDYYKIDDGLPQYAQSDSV